MSRRQRLSVPEDRDAVLIVPERASLGRLVDHNRATAATWDFTVGDLTALEMRRLCRADVLERAVTHTSELGVSAREVRDPSEPIIMTGHQPTLYHPGIWMKVFFMQQLAEETRASAVNLVVDTDAFVSVVARWPDLAHAPRVEEAVLVAAGGASCYAFAAVPSAEQVSTFCERVDAGTAPLESPQMAAAFERFKGGLEAARLASRSAAEMVTIARRNHERSAGSDYCELSLGVLSAGEGFSRFIAAVICDARVFAVCYNEALGAFRARHRTRSKAQPTPDLEISASWVELPLWLVDGSARQTLVVDVPGDRLRVCAGERVLFEGAPDARAIAAALKEAGCLIAPKALALTLFTRMFCCDAFIHGVGGARYDEVTDDLCRAYYGVEPPAYITGSMTGSLPLQIPAYDPTSESGIREEMSRLEHNPDTLIGTSEMLDPVTRAQAIELVARKQELVRAIGQPDADKKELGISIREANQALTQLLSPLKQRLQASLDAAVHVRATAEVLGGREYPLCFFDADEVARRVSRA